MSNPLDLPAGVPPVEPLVTRQQLAAVLGVKPRALKGAELPAIRIGTAVRYRISDVLAALAPRPDTARAR